jgi:leucyl aminopeptidase
MPLARIALQPARNSSQLMHAAHGMVILPAGDDLPADLPQRDQWLAVLKRKAMKPGEMAKTPLALDLPDGRRLALLMADLKLSRFERLARLRKAAMLLLNETSKRIAIRVAAVARANVLARELTALAPNELTPATYRKRIRDLAKKAGLAIEEFDFRALKKMGAGVFCAVAQDSRHEDAAIVSVMAAEVIEKDRGDGRQGHLLRHRRPGPCRVRPHRLWRGLGIDHV